MILHLDFETASRLDLTKVGSSRYSRDVSTVVTCVAWAFDDGEVQSATLPDRLPGPVHDHLEANGAYHAWNASFETAIIKNCFGVYVGPEQAVCTMQRALHAGLPASLAEAGPALGLADIKDAGARRLMLQMSRPRKDGTWWHDTDEAKLAALAKYCEQDVIAERAIGEMIPKLPPSEGAVSRLDAETNHRGIGLDLPLIARLLTIAGKETRLLDAECSTLTNGAVTSPGTQTERLIKWLRNEGVTIGDLSKESVRETLEPLYASTLPDHVRRVLEIRQKIAKSSIRKLQAMLNAVDGDGRVRGTLQYYGAGRTGRFSGRLIQPQNLPRPEKYANQAIAAVKELGLDNEGLRIFYDDPLTVVASCLRGCLIPAKGKRFLIYDLAQIEARVLAWLAGQNDVLDVFRRGEDVYEYAGRRIGGGRALGKVVTLACGYGMGPVKFQDTAKAYGVTLTLEEAEAAVAAWRQANDKIRYFWWDMENATQMALGYRNPKARRKTWIGTLGGLCTVGKVRIKKVGDTLAVKKPNGGKLFYHNPRLVPSIDGTRLSFEFDGVAMPSGKWAAQASYGGKMAENVTQAVARDIIVEAALRVSAKFPRAELVLSVHDELLFEVSREIADDPMTVLALNAMIEAQPDWADGLPIKAEGGVLDRYGKP
jgi:DNA polymerase